MPRRPIPNLPSPTELLPTSPAWPHALAALEPGDRPQRLFVAGTLPQLASAVAIVGTRYASESALEFTANLAATLAKAGHAILSGGAAGIDAAAHRGALQASGQTIAILATGLSRAYPSDHAPLFAQIARSGALLAEDCDPDRVHASSFLQRNRLIAALASAVVVVQAPVRSGALSTAHWARALHKPLFAVPAAPWDPRGEGCLALLRSGAQICTSATDILSVAAPGGRRALQTPPRRGKDQNDHEDLSDQARAVWKLLRKAPRYPDELSVCLDMPAARVQEALLALLLAGSIRRRVDGLYEKTRS